MTTTNIQNPGIAAFFQALTGMGGSASGAIDADLKRRQALGIDANTGLTQAQTQGVNINNGWIDRLNGNTVLQGTAAAGLNDANAGLVRANTAEVAPNALSNRNLQAGQTEQAYASGRNSDASARNTDALTLEVAPNAVSSRASTDAGTAQMQAETFAKILSNTGVQTAQDAANLKAQMLSDPSTDLSDPRTRQTLLALDVAIKGSAGYSQADGQASMAAISGVNPQAWGGATDFVNALVGNGLTPPPTATAKPPAPKTVTPSVIVGIRKEVAARVSRQFPDANFPPELLDEVTDAAAQAYAVGGDASAAINEVLQSLSSEYQDPSGLFNAGDYVTRNLPGLGGTAPGQPPAAPGAGWQTATGPNGQRIGLNPATNQWEPLP